MTEVDPSTDTPPDFKTPHDSLLTLDVSQTHGRRHGRFSLASDLFAGQDRDVSEVEHVVLVNEATVRIGSPLTVAPHLASGQLFADQVETERLETNGPGLANSDLKWFARADGQPVDFDNRLGQPGATNILIARIIITSPTSKKPLPTT